MRRSCCRNPSNSAAPARSNERTFFSWRKRRGEEAEMSSGSHLTTPHDRGQDVLQLPLGAPSPSYHLTARLESSSWPPPPPCWSRSGGGRERRTDERKPFQSFFFCCMRVERDKPPNLHCGNILKGLDEVLLIHGSSTRAVPPYRQHHGEKTRDTFHTFRPGNSGSVLCPTFYCASPSQQQQGAEL